MPYRCWTKATRREAGGPRRSANWVAARRGWLEFHPEGIRCGDWVIDTTGIRQLELWDVIPEEVEGYFCEFRPFVARCKFPDCSHLHETGCAVRAAVGSDR